MVLAALPSDHLAKHKLRRYELPTRGPRIEDERLMKYDLYIGRGCNKAGECVFGNPFSVDARGRLEAIARYKARARTEPSIQAVLPMLIGRRLRCHCQPDEPCHGDALICLLAEKWSWQLSKPDFVGEQERMVDLFGSTGVMGATFAKAGFEVVAADFYRDVARKIPTFIFNTDDAKAIEEIWRLILPINTA